MQFLQINNANVMRNKIIQCQLNEVPNLPESDNRCAIILTQQRIIQQITQSIHIFVWERNTNLSEIRARDTRWEDLHRGALCKRMEQENVQLLHDRDGKPTGRVAKG